MSESDTVFNERDPRPTVCTTHALYRSKLWQHDHCQHPRWIATNVRDVPRVMVMVFGVVSSEGHNMLPHIFEVSLKVNTKGYLDVLKSVVIPWFNQVAGGKPWAWQQDSTPAHKSKRDPGLASEGVLLCTLLSLASLLLRPEPTGLLLLVICREHHQHGLPQHQNQPDYRHPPSIHQAPAGACGKGLFPVPETTNLSANKWLLYYWMPITR